MPAEDIGSISATEATEMGKDEGKRGEQAVEQRLARAMMGMGLMGRGWWTTMEGSVRVDAGAWRLEGVGRDKALLRELVDEMLAGCRWLEEG